MTTVAAGLELSDSSRRQSHPRRISRIVTVERIIRESLRSQSPCLTDLAQCADKLGEIFAVARGVIEGFETRV